jgi:hypothetical protein
VTDTPTAATAVPTPEGGTPGPATLHVVAVSERGAFAVAVCRCGWESFARRSREVARREGRDHEVLHAI